MEKLLSIGEVAKQLNVASHTIRFWTEEFSEYIKFELGKGDRRYYTQSSLEMFHKIKNLIHAEGIKIKIIKEKKLLLEDSKENSNELNQKLIQTHKMLEEILNDLCQI